MPRSAGAGTVSVDLTLGPRAAAELAGVEHERRSRVQAGQDDTPASGTQTEPENRIRHGVAGQNGCGDEPLIPGARPAGRTSRSRTRLGHQAARRRRRSAATSLTRLEDTNELPTAPGQEDGLDVGEGGVHLGHRELVVEVADAAQALDDRDGVALAAEVDEQAVEAGDPDVGDRARWPPRASRCAPRA